jgi:hypothetical protein
MDSDPQGLAPEEPMVAQQPPVEPLPEPGLVVPDDQPKTNNLLKNKKLLGIIAAGLLVIIVAVVLVVTANNQRQSNEISQYEIDNQLEEYRAVANDSAGDDTEIVSKAETGLKDILADKNISPEQRYKANGSLSGLYYNGGKYEEAASVLEESLNDASLNDQQKLRTWGSLASTYRKQNNFAEQKKYLELIEANKASADDGFTLDMYIGWLDALKAMGY